MRKIIASIAFCMFMSGCITTTGGVKVKVTDEKGNTYECNASGKVDENKSVDVQCEVDVKLKEKE